MKNTLNESFNSWIKEIQSIEPKKNKLNENLLFYNMKLGSCKGVSYEGSKTSKTNKIGDGIIHWLSKIEEAENEIKDLDKININYINFKSRLTDNEQFVLESIVNRYSAVNIALQLKVSKQRIYDIKNSIMRKIVFNNI